LWRTHSWKEGTGTFFVRRDIYKYIYTASQIVSFLIAGAGSLASDLYLFQGLKLVVSSGYLGETSIFKIIMTNDVTLRSKRESTC